MDEYNIKTDFNNTHKTQEYDLDIQDMRIKLRSAKYLCEPQKPDKVTTLSGDTANDILDITTRAKAVKKNNLLKMIKHNTFFVNFGRQKIDIFNDKAMTNVDYDEQIEILLSMYEEDSDTFKYLNLYWKQSKSRQDYSGEEFVEELLAKTFNFEYENDAEND